MECRCLGAGGHCFWHKAIADRDDVVACRKNHQPPTTPTPCIYLGEEIKHRGTEARVFNCPLHGPTTLKRQRRHIRTCEDCKDRVSHEDFDPNNFIDPLRITDRNQVDTQILRGSMSIVPGAFLVCGGPSINESDYMRLNERGIFSIGINNVAGQVPCKAFVCSDPPMKFSHSIFYDPNIMKFLPTPKLSGGRANIRRKVKHDDGRVEFQKMPHKSSEMPNVWGFERRSWLALDDTWFLHPAAAWGNQDKGIVRGLATKDTKVAMTMLLGLRILQYLGIRRIFLFGVDFYMDPERDVDQNYSFGEFRNAGEVSSNNKHFRLMNDNLIKLRPVFERFGFYTYNCNPLSRLSAFEHVPFDKAVEHCRGVVEKEPDLQGWYFKTDDGKPKPKD